MVLTKLAPDPPCLLTNVNKKMVFFIEGFPYLEEPFRILVIIELPVEKC